MKNTVKKGLLIINLGTPEELTEEAVREYLDVFLSDPDVIDKDPREWRPILDKMLETRPAQALEAYKKIWMDEGSPLFVYTKRLKDKLEKRLTDYVVEYAMTYTAPSIEGKLDRMQQEGVTDLVILPLFPQYTMSSVRPIFKQITQYFANSVNIPRLTFITHYYDQEGYIETLNSLIHQKYNENPFEALILSYHGIAQHKIDQGDPRDKQCRATTNSIEKTMGIDIPVYHAYQSRFGNVAWTEPNLLDVLDDLAKQGIKKVGVAAPSFASDCVETLEEIKIDAAEHFIEAGGEELIYIPAINDDDKFVEFINNFIKNK